MSAIAVNSAQRDLYAELQRYFESMLQRAETGRVHLRAADILWERNRHALLGYYLHPFITDTALHSMQLFLNVIKQHGGMHRHQGGVVIFVLEGKGYTIAGEQQVDWQAGDLILLPMRPGGVAHQHVNTDPDKPSRWLAFISNAFREHSGYEIVQLKDASDYQPPGATEGVNFNAFIPLAMSGMEMLSGDFDQCSLVTIRKIKKSRPSIFAWERN